MGIYYLLYVLIMHIETGIFQGRIFSSIIEETALSFFVYQSIHIHITCLHSFQFSPFNQRQSYLVFCRHTLCFSYLYTCVRGVILNDVHKAFFILLSFLVNNVLSGAVMNAFIQHLIQFYFILYKHLIHFIYMKISCISKGIKPQQINITSDNFDTFHQSLQGDLRECTISISLIHRHLEILENQFA